MQIYLKTLLIIPLLSCILSYSKAQDRSSYSSECLHNIAKSIGYSDASPQDEFLLEGQDSIPIKIEHDKNGVIIHIGVDIFGDEIKVENSAILFNFVERYLLELLLEVDDLDVSERNQIEDVEIIGNLRDIPLFTLSDSNEISFEIVSDGNRYDISWSDAKHKFTISFPANYALLVGKSKIELEDDFYCELQNYSNNHTPSHNATINDPKLRKIANNLYEYDKGYYIIPSMRNIQYLELVDNTYDYIYNEKKPYETLSNLATLYNSSSHSMVLNIEQHKYGAINNKFLYKLNDLIAFCLDEGCTPYISFEQGESEKITAIIFMVNYDYKYNHMLQLYVENVDFLKGDEAISCEINTYIPTHNISKLYDEKNQVNSKHKIKL